MPHRLLTYSGLAVAAVALVLGVPLFLRMPPWCDLTLYDEAARNLLRGGVHYRDVFDTNLPGFVWLLTGVEALFGDSFEVIRLVDLCVVAGITALLDRTAVWGGATAGARAWLLAGVCLFYPYTSEFDHAQRDIWMLLPALAATAWRVRTPDFAPRAAFGQGLLWGVAVWIKPHVVVVTVAVWLASLPAALRKGRRAALRDAGGLLAGGVLAGALGVAALLLTGTWPYFVEVFTVWNTGYVDVMWREFDDRLRMEFLYFPPWCYLQVVTIPLAIYDLVAGAIEGARKGGKPAGYARVLLAALYLSWVAQALVLQRAFHYAHVPEILLLFAVGAAHRLVLPAVVAAFLAASGVLILDSRVPAQNPSPAYARAADAHAVFVLHPMLDRDRLALWPNCFRSGLSDAEYYERRDGLALVTNFYPAPDWGQLHELAEELKRRGVRDGEVLAWDDSPHPVYRLAGVTPGFRFLHVYAMGQVSPEAKQRILAEKDAATKVRYAVADLKRVGFLDPNEVGDRAAHGRDLLPPSLSDEVRATYPYTLKAVFRTRDNTGRYVLFGVPRK